MTSKTAFQEHVTFLATTWLDGDVDVTYAAINATSASSFEQWLRDYVKQRFQESTSSGFAADVLKASFNEIDFTALVNKFWRKWDVRRARDSKGITTEREEE